MRTTTIETTVSDFGPLELLRDEMKARTRAFFTSPLPEGASLPQTGDKVSDGTARLIAIQSTITNEGERLGVARFRSEVLQFLEECYGWDLYVATFRSVTSAEITAELATYLAAYDAARTQVHCIELNTFGGEE